MDSTNDMNGLAPLEMPNQEVMTAHEYVGDREMELVAMESRGRRHRWTAIAVIVASLSVMMMVIASQSASVHRAKYESQTVNRELVKQVNEVLQEVSSASGSQASYLPGPFQLIGIAGVLIGLAAILRSFR